MNLSTLSAAPRPARHAGNTAVAIARPRLLKRLAMGTGLSSVASFICPGHDLALPPQCQNVALCTIQKEPSDRFWTTDGVSRAYANRIRSPRSIIS